MKLYAVYDGYDFEVFSSEDGANQYSMMRTKYDRWFPTDCADHMFKIDNSIPYGVVDLLGLAEPPEDGAVIPLTITLGQPWVVEEVWSDE